MDKSKKVSYFINVKKAAYEMFDLRIDYVLKDIYRIYGRRDIEIILIDENGVSDSAINEIAERFIDCCMAEKNRNYAVPRPKDADEFCEITKAFLDGLFSYAYRERNTRRDDCYCMDIIARTGQSFKVNLPEELISEDTYDGFIALGPDYLKGFLSPEDIFKYVIPAYFFFLCENDAFDDPVLGAFDLYKIGLH